MSYDPTNWKSGDVVTSAKLNKMEQGIANAGGGGGGGVLVLHETYTETTSTLDKTYAEIAEAAQNGFVMLALEGAVPTMTDFAYLNSIGEFESQFNVFFNTMPKPYIAASESDYPVMDIS